MQKAIIRFYDPKAPFFQFSNFFDKSPFSLDGQKWSSSELYYQAQKFSNVPEYQELIRQCDTPNKAFKMAHQRKMLGWHANVVINKKTNKTKVNDAIDQYKDIQPRSDWHQVNIDVMRKALRAKFEQNPRLLKMLKDTGDAVIIEASPRDWFWGEGKDGKGQNMLGKLLMELRDSL